MSSPNDVVILSATRTAIGSFLGGLSTLTGPELGAVAVREAIARSGVDPATIDEVILGCVLQGGVGQAPARQAAIKGGVPATVPALTINKVCGSGLKAVMLGAQSIKAGDNRIVVSGGFESMSNAPYFLSGARTGVKLGDQKFKDLMINDGLWCSFCDWHMGSAAEYTAKTAGISRARQDEFSVDSQRKAVAAIAAGKFKAEITPVSIAQRKGDPKIVEVDEGPRPDAGPDGLAKLRPAFDKEGTVTAGNASTLNDGGAAVVLTTRARAEALGRKPLARVMNYATGSRDPKDLFFAPIDAVKALMAKDGLAIGDYDLIEANEAFAAQALANGDALGWDWARVNVNGGAIALGHPIGASGCRVLVTLLHALKQTGGHRGLATLCLGGGSAVALSVELEGN